MKFIINLINKIYIKYIIYQLIYRIKNIINYSFLNMKYNITIRTTMAKQIIKPL